MLEQVYYPFGQLPKRAIEGVCITTNQQDHWAVAYSTFILSKQAGFDIEFQHDDQPLKDAMLYILPSIKGVWGIPRHRWMEILNKVKEGATLYISIEDGYVADFEEVTGLKVQTRYRRSGVVETVIGGTHLNFNALIKLAMEATRAQVLGTEKDGNPIFATSAYGKGRVFFMAMRLFYRTEFIGAKSRRMMQ
ncbi:MAG: hypothetical protein H7X94_12975 [Vallitaleaceae bacterium]|nr:hypothetical protein [Vallitaleaceae bacterium]